jgi:hypothetical protein
VASTTAIAVISVETETVAVGGVDVSGLDGEGLDGIEPLGPLTAAA